MIGERPRFIQSVQTAADLFVVAAAWLAAYPIRFYLLPLRIQHVPPFSRYAMLTVIALLIWAPVLQMRPQRAADTAGRLYRKVLVGLRGHLLAFIAFVVITFFVSSYKPSRVVLLLFLTLSTGGILAVRLAVYRWQIVRYREGRGVTRCLVVGTGKLARSLVQRLHERPELGQRVVGYLTDQFEEIGGDIDGLPVFDSIQGVQEAVEAQQIGRVYLALPIAAHERLRTVLTHLEDEMVDVKVLVDLLDFVVLRSGVEDFDGLPIISLKRTPLAGWGAVFKRAFDFTFAAGVLLAGSPVFLTLAALVKLSSRGPVFYGQERMGLDGRIFHIYKFRSMRIDAEAQTGAVWAVENDPRRTRIGAFLRKTNLDELPQFLNVLRGEMSVVGPRPERPVFIEKFRKEIPKYMLRHKSKAGLTGWAQVNGWRGDTDLGKRIEYDLYYIENWSFWFDLRIIWMTLFSKKAREHAY